MNMKRFNCVGGSNIISLMAMVGVMYKIIPQVTVALKFTKTLKTLI